MDASIPCRIRPRVVVTHDLEVAIAYRLLSAGIKINEADHTKLRVSQFFSNRILPGHALLD